MSPFAFVDKYMLKQHFKKWHSYQILLYNNVILFCAFHVYEKVLNEHLFVNREQTGRKEERDEV